jgi:hypothetical protein
MAPNYPWYSVVEGDELEQGDFLFDCPVLEPAIDLFPLEQTGTQSGVQARVNLYDVIILSQSCDLVQGKLDIVLVCPHWPLSIFEQTNDFFRSKRGKEEIRRGNIPGYHMLASCELEKFEHEIRVVSFRQVFGLPFGFVRELAVRQSPRPRLLPPYREHLAQAFARFFMRVGLPVDIPPFR